MSCTISIDHHSRAALDNGKGGGGHYANIKITTVVIRLYFVARAARMWWMLSSLMKREQVRKRVLHFLDERKNIYPKIDQDKIR